MGRILWFLHRKFEGGKVWEKRKGGVAHMGIYLKTFFFFGFLLTYIYKAHHIGL